MKPIQGIKSHTQWPTKLSQQQRIASALFIVNKSSGNGRTSKEIRYLQHGFHHHFAPIANRVFAITTDHDEVIQLTRNFLTSAPGPWLLLSGGGGGTNRALVQGLLTEIDEQTVRLDDVRISSLRLGSGNLIPKYFGLPAEPLVAMQHIANDLFAGRSANCCIYQCTFHHPNDKTRVEYGLTMGGVGQFARVPDDIKRWRRRYKPLMCRGFYHMPLETINTFQYVVFSLIRAGKCLIHPQQAELVKIKYQDRSEQFRLFSGMLLNFDFPQVPFQGNCTISEPRLMLCLIPQTGRRQLTSALFSWPKLDNYIRKYEISSGQPVEIHFLENSFTTIALDEDTFTAPNRISFNVAALIKFVTGRGKN